MKHNLALRSKEILIHVPLSEISQSEKGKDNMIPHMRGTRCNQIHRDSIRMMLSRGLGGGDRGASVYWAQHFGWER